MKAKKFANRLWAMLRNNSEFAEFFELENLDKPPSLKWLLTRIESGMLKALPIPTRKTAATDMVEHCSPIGPDDEVAEDPITVPKWYKAKSMPNKLGGPTVRWEITYRGHRFGLVCLDRFNPDSYAAIYRDEPKMNYIRTLQDAVNKLVEKQMQYLADRVKK